MANKNINDLPTATSLNAGDKLEILQGGTNKQIDASLLGGSSTTPNLAQVLTEGYTANSSVLLTDGTATELLLDPSYIQLKSLGLGSVLFDADAILDVVNYKGNELATLNDIPSLTGYEQTVNKDATGGYVGLTALKINFKNVLNTFTSFFTNSNTAARTYTFQDRNGTIADDTDLGLKSPIASPTFTGTPLAPTASAGTNSTQIATTAYVDAKGAHQGFYTGKWKTIPFASVPTGLTGWVGGIIYIPIPIGENQTFIKIGEEVTAGIAGQNIRLALYRSVNGLPATLIEDSGNLSAVTNGLKDFTFTSPVTVNASERQVFAAIQVSNNSVGLRVANSTCLNYFNGSGTTGSLFVQVQSFGAFPASATPSAYNGVTSPLVSLLMQ